MSYEHDDSEDKGDKPNYGTFIPATCSRAGFAMSNTARTILIALGVALLVVILVPALFMGGMMAAMRRMMGAPAVAGGAAAVP